MSGANGASPEADALLESVKAQGEMISNMKKQGIVEKAKVRDMLCNWGCD